MSKAHQQGAGKKLQGIERKQQNLRVNRKEGWSYRLGVEIRTTVVSC